MAAEAKKIRSEIEQEQKMDTQFRNPNSSWTFETFGRGRGVPQPQYTDFYSFTGTAKVGGSLPVKTETSESPSTSGNVDMTDSSYDQKLKAYRAKIPLKKNHIWSDIANAEAMDETVKQFDVVSMVDMFSINRGPETYVVGARRKRKISEAEEGEIVPAPPTDDDYESDSSISSGGLSDDTNNDLKTRYAARKSTSRNGRKIIKSRKSLNSNTTKSVDSEMTVEVKPKKKSIGRTILEENMADKPDYKVAFYMAKRLNERKKHLFSSSMKLLGRETCLKLFFKTLKIERLGGMMIKNKSRRRTPGGVFLYMVRKDSRLPKEAIDEIFKDEREFIRQTKRKACPENTQKWENKLKGRILAKFDKSAELQGKSLMTGKNETVDSDVEADEIENSYDVPSASMQTDNVDMPLDEVKVPKREKVVYEDIPDPDHYL